MTVEIDGTMYHTVNEVAEQLDVSRQTLWRWRQEGKVPIGRRYRGREIVFSPAEVESIADYANRVEPLSPILAHQLRLFDGRTKEGQ